MEGKSYDDRLTYFWTLEERRNRQDLIKLFKILSVCFVLELMNCLCWLKTRKVLWVTVFNERKLGAPGILLGIFSNRVVNRWNLLDQRTVDGLECIQEWLI